MTGTDEADVESLEAEEPAGVYLARHLVVNGMAHIDAIRPLSAEEHEQVRTASAFAQAIARRTPYHAFVAARDRFHESFRQFAADSSESPDARHRRASAALNDLCTEVMTHADAWNEFVNEHTGDSPDVAEAATAWRSHPATAFARALAAKPGTLTAAPDGQPTAEMDGATVSIAAWIRDVEVQAVLLADVALQAVEGPFKAAASHILGLASEVLSGSPFLMPAPGPGGTELKLDIGTLDVESVRAADSFMFSARSMATSLRKAADSTVTGPAPLEEAAVEQPEDPSLGGEQQPSMPLPEVQVSLRKVAQAIATNVDGLASRWARLFDQEEFFAAVEQDKALASSLVQPIVRSIQREEDDAVAAGGVAPTLPGYPVPLSELGGWLEDHREDVAAVALVTVLSAYLQSMGQLTFARALSFGKGDDFIEFDPFRTTTLHRQAKLLGELADASEGSDESDRLRTAVYLCGRLGLPEAQLLYACRQLSQLKPDLFDSLAPARDALDTFAEGGSASLSEHVILADVLTREIDSADQSDG